MDLALAGQVAGRILISYVIVWLLMLIISRFNIKAAFYHAHRWYGFILLTLLFLLGISSHLVSKGVL